MADKKMKILVINPGSTSTKVSLFLDEEVYFEKDLFHDAPLLLQFRHVNDQLNFRCTVILDMLKEEHVDPATIDAFAWTFAQKYNKPAYTLDPTNVDEYGDYARLTGIKGIYRVSHSHVLNQKAVAKAHSKAHGVRYEDCNYIVAHIDGGITVSAHDHGRMVDGNMGADGEGAFTPTRIGSIPVLGLLDYLETHTLEEVRLKCARSGGFVEYFGTSNSDKIHEMVEQGDKKACLVWNTMIYQISKMIGEMSAVLCGKVDAILLTGGLMRFDDIREGIEKHCGFIAPIFVYPGELEQSALALPALKALRGELVPHTYSGKNVWEGFAFLND